MMVISKTFFKKSFSKIPSVTSNLVRGISSYICLGAGCFWGVEKYIHNYITKNDSLQFMNGQVGYMGEAKEVPLQKPTYEKVCSGNTEFIEVYQCQVKNITDEEYEKMIRLFFSIHDPTTYNSQGFDIGKQYASVIFYYDERQLAIANQVKEELQNILITNKIIGYSNRTVETVVRPALKFYDAEQYHQRYLHRNPGGYCNHFTRDIPWRRRT